MFLESVTCNWPLWKSCTQFSFIEDAAYIYFLQSCIPSLLPWYCILLWSSLFILLFQFCRLDAGHSLICFLLCKCTCKFICHIWALKMWALVAGSLFLLPKKYLHVFSSFKTQTNPLFVYFLDGGDKGFLGWFGVCCFWVIFFFLTRCLFRHLVYVLPCSLLL